MTHADGIQSIHVLSIEAQTLSLLTPSRPVSCDVSYGCHLSSLRLLRTAFKRTETWLSQTRTMKRASIDKFSRSCLIGFGSRLRQTREKKGLSRKALAKLARIAPTTLARIERNQQRPYVDTVAQLAEALGMRLAELVPDWDEADFDTPRSGIIHPGFGLRRLRKSAGLTKRAAATAAGVSLTAYSRCEDGQHATRNLIERVNGDVGDIISDALAVLLGFEDAAALTKACRADGASEPPAPDIPEFLLDR
ncbi:MAG: hypothetical protein CNE89_07090 [Sphingomonadaceae bacterium MED-G03]|nr:MAG: hypothetical protein CNE89_07090 [Sphingomonadaceae bacterium MED-G03]